jgi:hypothetical protein
MYFVSNTVGLILAEEWLQMMNEISHENPQGLRRGQSFDR